MMDGIRILAGKQGESLPKAFEREILLLD